MDYSIGDYVIVTHKMCRINREHINWVPLKLDTPQQGQVVGLATRYDGKIISPVTHGYYDDYESNYFVPTKTHVFWHVKFGLLNKPVLVQAEDMRFATVGEVEDLPKLCVRGYWNDKMRQAISKDSKNWARDSKGRWTSV